MKYEPLTKEKAFATDEEKNRSLHEAPGSSYSSSLSQPPLIKGELSGKPDALQRSLQRGVKAGELSVKGISYGSSSTDVKHTAQNPTDFGARTPSVRCPRKGKKGGGRNG